MQELGEDNITCYVARYVSWRWSFIHAGGVAFLTVLYMFLLQIWDVKTFGLVFFMVVVTFIVSFFTHYFIQQHVYEPACMLARGLKSTQ